MTQAEVAREYLYGFTHAAESFVIRQSYPLTPEEVEYNIEAWKETRKLVSCTDLEARVDGFIDGYLSAWGA